MALAGAARQQPQAPLPWPLSWTAQTRRQQLRSMLGQAMQTQCRLQQGSMLRGGVGPVRSAQEPAGGSAAQAAHQRGSPVQACSLMLRHLQGSLVRGCSSGSLRLHCRSWPSAGCRRPGPRGPQDASVAAAWPPRSSSSTSLQGTALALQAALSAALSLQPPGWPRGHPPPPRTLSGLQRRLAAAVSSARLRAPAARPGRSLPALIALLPAPAQVAVQAGPVGGASHRADLHLVAARGMLPCLVGPLRLQVAEASRSQAHCRA